MELTKAEKGKRKLVKDRYIYVFKKVPASDISSWQCIFRRKVGQCYATVQISPTDEFAEKGNNQTHAPSHTQVEVIKNKVGMKCKAKTTEETVQQILGKQLSNISENAAEILPSTGTMRQSIRKSGEDDNISQIPVNREDTPVLPNEYQITKSREQFFMFDSSEEDPEGMLILDSEIGISFSSELDNCFSDGTFRVCPEIFIQLYTVYAQQREKISHASLVH